MARVLLLSVVLHVALAAMLVRLRAPMARTRAPVEITFAPRADGATGPAAVARPQPQPPAVRARSTESATEPALRARSIESATEPALRASSIERAQQPARAAGALVQKAAAGATSPRMAHAPRAPTASVDSTPIARPVTTPPTAVATRAPRPTFAPDPPAATEGHAPTAAAPSAHGESSPLPAATGSAATISGAAVDSLRARAEPRVGPTAEPATPAARSVDLFAASVLQRAAAVSVVAPRPADRAWRPRRGVGGDGAAGGVDVASFLSEDAARQRVAKGAIAPELRELERRLDSAFTPSFIQADISNRAELFIKQMRGFWRNPPKTGELQRGVDPTKETYQEKLRSMHPERAFFLGRQVEVFVRQHADGSIAELALRNASGYRAFDDAAVAAVTQALGGHLPAGADGRGGDVRTLWQLEATAYVVVSPNPELVFDESSGKHEWIYPLQKKVDHHVRLMARY